MMLVRYRDLGLSSLAVILAESRSMLLIGSSSSSKILIFISRSEAIFSAFSISLYF